MVSSVQKCIHLILIIVQVVLIHGHTADSVQNNSPVLSYNVIDGLPSIYINAESEKIGHTWSCGVVWDKPLIQKFYSLLPVQNFFVVIDFGAQTGSFSLLAKYFPNSVWYAFEPLFEAATMLKDNIALNNIDNVFVYQMAGSDVSGKAILKMPTMNEWGLATLGENIARFTVVAQREIDCIDLDSFIEAHDIKKVHFMKLDTEGSEFSILRGAQKTIMRDRPIILMEYNEINMRQCGIFRDSIDTLLTEMGYEWKLVSSEDILCLPVVH